MEKLSNLHRISKLYGLPEFVKDASFEEKQDILPSSAFADPWSRKYPCHTKSATYVSNIGFWEQAVNDNNPQDPIIARRLMEFARDWDIEAPVKQALTKIAQDKHNAIPKLTNDDFAFVVDNGNTVDRKFPIADAETVKQSAHNFTEQRHLFPYDWRKEIASKITEKAAALNVSLPLEVQAKLDLLINPKAADSEDIADAIETRAYTVKDAAVRSRLLKVAGSVRSRPPTLTALYKVASVLDEVDRKTGLYKEYAGSHSRGHLALPETVCFVSPTLEKSAHDNRIQLQTGNALTKEMLKEAGLEAFKVLPEYIDSISTYGKLDLDKAAEVLPTMPVDDARLLEQSLGAVKTANFNLGGGDVTQPIKPLLPQQRQLASKGVPWDKIGVRQINLKGEQTKQADITGDGVGRPPGGNMGAYNPATSYNKNLNKFPSIKPSQIAAQQQPARGLPTMPNPMGMKI
jgi:hypothetical protein